MFLEEGKKLYFASDFHLGVPSKELSLQRERKIVEWLKSIESSASTIFLVGDVFDFWFEYKYVIPKNHVRLQGQLANMCDKGLKIYYFRGNHDMWAFNYFNEELGVQMVTGNLEFTCNDKKFMVGHGDGLGPEDKGYKFIKKVFSSALSQWLFKFVHPDLGISVANFWSRKSREGTLPEEEVFKGENEEWLLNYCNTILNEKYFDYFIFGHRHLLLDVILKNNKSRYINLGDWFKNPHCGIFDGKEFTLQKI